jgi:histidinol phosphatase-like enzyme
MSTSKGIIVVDFDDTLAIHPGSKAAENIPVAEPNIPLINKLNELHNNGYSIHIYTARGHLSASSRIEADSKYRHIILKWLDKNNLKFDKLSFEKPLGVYYIDDLAMRPDELHLLDKLIK